MDPLHSQPSQEGKKDLEPVREDAHRAPTVPEVLRESARARETPSGFRRLEVGEVLTLGDQVWPAKMTAEGMHDTICTGQTMEAEDVGFYYRPIQGAAEGEALPEAPAEGSPSLPSAPSAVETLRKLEAAATALINAALSNQPVLRWADDFASALVETRAALSKLEGR